MHITTLTESEIERAIKLITPKGNYNVSQSRIRAIKSLAVNPKASTEHVNSLGITNKSYTFDSMNEKLRAMGLMICCERKAAIKSNKWEYSFFRI